jgi:cytochrome c5
MKHVVLLLMIGVLTTGVAIGTVSGQETPEAEQRITIMPSENPAQLIQAPGVELVQANCLACHTAQPILTHNGFSADVWASEVQRMRETYGAQISDEDAAAIVRYLQENYSGEPISAENMLLNGINATRDQEPLFEGQQGTPEPAGTPVVVPAATPAP